MNSEVYILLGVKDNNFYYISNTNPVMWTSDIRESKRYHSRYSAEVDILRDYDNYRTISSLIGNGKLDVLYLLTEVVGSVGEYIEKGRVKIL